MVDTSFAQRKLFYLNVYFFHRNRQLVDRFTLYRFTAAAIHGCVSEVVRLLYEGMPIDIVDQYGWTALQLAASSNRTTVIYELLQREANLNKRSRYNGRTALHWSAMYNNTDAIWLLLKSSASTTIKHDEGRTPIDVAREKNHEEAVLLLQH